MITDIQDSYFGAKRFNNGVSSMEFHLFVKSSLFQNSGEFKILFHLLFECYVHLDIVKNSRFHIISQVIDKGSQKNDTL